MIATREDYNKRKHEIGRYFELLTLLDNDNPSLHYLDATIPQYYKIDKELQKILKANGFILIYNLIEATCRNSLIAILNAITAKGVTFEGLTEQTRVLWIKQKVSNLRDPKTKSETIELEVHRLVQTILDGAMIEFGQTIRKMQNPELSEMDLFGISGNIDAEKIRKLARICGFNSAVSAAKERAGADLETIKRKRNHLAHGRITFAECGMDNTVPDMVRYKENAIDYLNGVLDNIEAFIANDQYLLPVPHKQDSNFLAKLFRSIFS